MYDSAGKQTWGVEYDVYGKIRKRSVGGAVDCPFRYQGQYEDEETGLYYNRFRYYEPSKGVYLSQDPIRMKGNRLGFYSYVKDTGVRLDQIGLMDPSDIQFSQDSISDVFTEGPWKGKSLDEAIEATKAAGALPEGLTLNVMELNGGRDIVTLNNRTLYVAQQAGIVVNPNFVGPEGINKLNKLLDGKMPLEPGEQPVIKCKK
jgi:RHS repeat-associated protein